MTIDQDDMVERDDLAPAERLHNIAEILAAGVRRRREDSRRLGELSPSAESERDGLELSEPVRPDGPRG